MYAPEIVDRRLTKLADVLRKDDPGFEVCEYSVPEVDEWVERLNQVYDADAQRVRRPLNAAEVDFVAHELMRSKVDWKYWAMRYCWIKAKSQQKVRLNLLESQEIILNWVARAEREALQGESGDGILLAILKARQLGASTLSEAIIGHRSFFYGNTLALIAGDTEDQSGYLFDMVERIYDNLPWWMKPERDYHVKDRQMYFSMQDSLILVEWSRSVRGGSTLGQNRGQIGRGKTPATVHLSELSTWHNPEQIADSLEPAIPRHMNTFVVYESTARGRGNEWHNIWLKAKKGLGRLRPVFVPWYAETKTYTRPAPTWWSPSELALMHATRVEETSSMWCGRPIRLSRDQLYWWETTRASYVEDHRLHVFLAEFCADDMEAFQTTGASCIPNEVLSELRLRSSRPTSVIDVKPRMGHVVQATH